MIKSMTLKHLCLSLFFAVAITATVQAKEAVPMAEDPVVEARLVKISDDLRCLVCQNESLSGSHADLAKDLRREIRGMIKSGKSDAEILDFMVARYGDFVLYRPPVKPTTWLLWGGPFILLIAAVFGLLHYLRRRSSGVAGALESAGTTDTTHTPQPAALSAAEIERANRLLGTEPTTPSEKEKPL